MMNDLNAKPGDHDTVRNTLAEVIGVEVLWGVLNKPELTIEEVSKRARLLAVFQMRALEAAGFEIVRTSKSK